MPDGDQKPVPAHLAHVPAHCLAGLEAAHADKPLAKYQGNAEPILARLRDGEKAKAIADSIGVSDVNLYAFLLRHAPQAWMELSAGRALSRKANAEELLDDETADKNTISRARTTAQLAQWDLERANRKLYGEVKNDSAVTVQVLVSRDGDNPTAIQVETP